MLRLLELALLLGSPLSASRAAVAQVEAVREVTLAPPAGTRIEHFVLADPVSEEPLALVRLLSGPDPEARALGAAGVRLESDTLFLAEQTRVVHTERLRVLSDGSAAQSLVWREIRAASGRTLHVEGAHGGELRSAETVGGEVLRRTHAWRPNAVLPLCLIESARAGAPLAASHAVFQPLSCAFEELAVELSLDRSSGVEERVLALGRAGGVEARYVFQGERLVGFRLQAGGPWARPISRDDYERLCARHAAARESAGEEVAALQPERAAR